MKSNIGRESVTSLLKHFSDKIGTHKKDVVDDEIAKDVPLVSI